MAGAPRLLPKAPALTVWLGGWVGGWSQGPRARAGSRALLSGALPRLRGEGSASGRCLSR